MSQAQVITLIKKCEVITIKEASEKIGISFVSCWNNFKRLEKEGIIIKIEDSNKYKYNGEGIQSRKKRSLQDL